MGSKSAVGLYGQIFGEAIFICRLVVIAHGVVNAHIHVVQAALVMMIAQCLILYVSILLAHAEMSFQVPWGGLLLQLP